MDKAKDKAFEGAEEIKNKIDEVEDNTAKPEEIKEEQPREIKSKTQKRVEKVIKGIEVGDFVIYEATNGSRCVQVLDTDDNTVTVIGDEGTQVKISLDRVKKA